MSGKRCAECEAKLSGDGSPCPDCGIGAAGMESQTVVVTKSSMMAKVKGTISAMVAKLQAAPKATKSLVSKLKAAASKLWVSPASWWRRLSKRAKLGVIVGAASAAVVLTGLAVFLVLFLRPVFVIEAMETEDAIVCGEDILVTVDLVNEGRTGGEYEVCALLDGENVETRLLTLDSGAREQVSLTLAEIPAGHYEVALAGWPGLVREVWVMTPADVRMGDISVQPDPIDINDSDEAEVLVALANMGEATGSYELEVAVDGEVLETREVEVKGGAEAEESFAFKVAAPGSCQIAVNGELVDVEIYRLERPSNGEVLFRQAVGPRSALEVKNLNDMDCVVVLTEQGEDEPYLAVYVHGQSECIVRGILGGTYECSYSFGEDWCTYRNGFTRNEWCDGLDERLTFKTSWSGAVNAWSGDWTTSLKYTVLTLELGGSSGESLSTSHPTWENSGVISDWMPH